MSAQQRYRILVPYLTGLYSTDTQGRLDMLRDGLLALSECSGGDWAIIRADAERLLRVWSCRENNDPTAREIASQILGALGDFTEGDNTPTLVIKEEEPPLVISHVQASQVVSMVTQPKVVSMVTQPQVVSMVTQPKAVSVAVAQPQVVSMVTQPKAGPVVLSTSLTGLDEDSDDTPIEESEEEEEEEEGMEVARRRIQGRDYWWEEKSNKLYAFTGEDDDVGDEVGILLANGKPVLLACK